jgi:hypothetical protein
MPTPEVHKVTVQLEKPSRRYPSGKVTFGYYTLVDDLLTMTDPNGGAAEDGTGKRYTHKLMPGEDANAIAKRLTKQLRQELRGGPNAPPGDFHRKINYPKSGLEF